MAANKTTRAKTQTLSLRLDPKTRFVLEFIAKVNRQSITTVVEEAIRQAGSQIEIPTFDHGMQTWADYWDISEGVRVMNMLAEPTDIPSDYEDDELRAFLKQHIEFFSESSDLSNPTRLNVDVLWSKIDSYLETWAELKRSKPFSVGHQMVEDLKNAGLDPPVWPRGKKIKPPPSKPTPSPSDFDDDIPF